MASSSPATIGGGAPESEKKKKKTHLRKISDFLLHDGDDVAPASPPPRLRLPGFTCARIRFCRSRGRRGGRKISEAASPSSSSPPAAAEDATSGRDAAAATATEAAAGGLGLSLLFLLARTSVELSKIAEVRAQMEALLADMRHAAARRDLKPTTSSSPSSSTSSSLGSIYSMATGDDGDGEGETIDEDINPLQVELEDGDCSSSDDGGGFIELVEGGFVAGGNGDGDGIGEGGVNGVELERRLREVKREREKERVAELEAALRRARRRLMEKEMEVRLWKDTAELALQHRPSAAAADRRKTAMTSDGL
uniref:Uncharacterized protein n=1 Tax=Leersia perrieri TaxID=77586 RepID=A0A0D9VD02_9ORYZ